MGSFRSILKNWKLSAVAAFSLTVAMALGVVGFAIANSALFRLPAAKNASELFQIYTGTPRARVQSISYPDYEYYRDHNRSFSDIAAYPFSIDVQALRFENRMQLAVACQVSDNYFSTMGIRPVLGRVFERGDDRRNTPLAVMTYAGWLRWNRDPNIIGKQMKLNQATMTIIGVAPQGFTGPLFGFAADLVTNFWDRTEEENSRETSRLTLLGRLRPGVTRDQARADLQGLSGQLARDFPKQDGHHVADFIPATALPPDSVAAARLASALLAIIIVFILLIACANAANLLLAIATGRRREALIKLALGATRARLIREFLVETAVLCAISAVCGFGLAWLVLARISDFKTAIPGMGLFRIAADLHPDWVVVAASAVMVTIACAGTGIAPALYGSSVSVAGALSGETAVGGTRKGIIRNALVIVQVAVSTLVLVGVALCFRSLQNLRHVDTGFSARNLVGIQFRLEREDASEAKARVVYSTLRESASKIAGVEAISLAEGMPMQVGGSWNEIRAGDPSHPLVGMRGAVVDGDYFATAGIRLLEGRTFDASDLATGREVTIVSREAARRLGPGADLVGRTITFADGKRTARVIGIATDVKVQDLDEATQPLMYFALSQHFTPFVTLIARTRGDPRLWGPGLERAAREAGAWLPLPPATIGDVMDLSLVTQIWIFECVAGLSTLALFLAVLGLFGAVSYSVGERKRELGIRVALGALPSHLLKMILGQTLAVVGAGVAVGLGLGIAASTLLRSQFYGVHRVEWLALAPVAIAMTLVACAIAHFAARAAVHADPMDTLWHS
jgi:predicted permease